MNMNVIYTYINNIPLVVVSGFLAIFALCFSRIICRLLRRSSIRRCSSSSFSCSSLISNSTSSSGSSLTAVDDGYVAVSWGFSCLISLQNQFIWLHIGKGSNQLPWLWFFNTCHFGRGSIHTMLTVTIIRSLSMS